MIEHPQFILAFDGATQLVQRLYDAEVRRLDRRATRSFYLHRATGIGLIVLSASLPFLSGLDAVLVRAYLIPGVAFAISVLSSLVTFMAFGDSWNGYRSAEIRTRYARINWDAKMLEAKLADELPAGLTAVTAATTQFIQEMDSIAAAETRNFFQKVQEGQGVLGGQKK